MNQNKNMLGYDASSEPSGEEKAFVYQQALELTPLLMNGNNKEPIAVILKKGSLFGEVKVHCDFCVNSTNIEFKNSIRR